MHRRTSICAFPAALASLALIFAASSARSDEPMIDIGNVDFEALLDLKVVAASLHEERTSEAAAAVFVLSGDDLRRQAFRTLQEALRSIPGLFAYRDDLYPMIGVRGVGVLGDYSTGLLILIDGHPLNNSVAIGQSYLGRDLPVPLRAVERIEVIKGPVGSVYGPTAFLGVVNVVTQGSQRARSGAWAEMDAAQGHALPGSIGAQLARAAGELQTFVAAEAFRTSGYDYTFPELVAASDRPAPPGGRVAGMASADAVTGYGRIAWRDLNLAGACNQATSGTPTAPYSSQLLDPANRITNHTCYVQLGYERDLGAGVALTARAAYDDFLYVDRLVYEPPPAGYGTYHDEGRDRWLSGELRLTYRPALSTLLVGGATVERHDTLQHSYAEGLPTVLIDPEQGVGVGEIVKRWAAVNAYVLAEQSLGQELRLHAGLTLNVNGVFGSRLTPKAAIIFTPGAADVLKAVYSEGFRAPTATEAFFADGTDFLANPALKPETVQSLELIGEHRFGRNVELTLSLFQNRYRQLIQFVTVPAPGLGRAPDPNEPADFRQIAENVQTLRLRGAEAALSVRWGDMLRLWGGVTAQHVDLAGWPNFPAVTGNVAASTRALWRPLTLSLHGTFGAARAKLSDGSRTDVGPFAVIGTAAVLDVPGTSGLSVELSVENLLAASAPSPVPGDFAPITQISEPPRSYRLAVHWRFE
jgi:outer membrane receptor protein involved in Fe transport